jgi:hypothetical protein
MDVVDSVNEEYLSIVNFLDTSMQPSLSSDTNKYFKKIIVLSSASYFEDQIQNILINFIAKESGGNEKVISFFKKKAIGMQYHTYFNWGEKNNAEKPGKNANSFFSLFGDEFKKIMESEINKNDTIKDSMKCFIEIGHLRNILIHSNFAAYNLDNKTTEEVYNLHKKSLVFIEFIRNKLQ